MTKVIIGVDPHKLSATIEVVDRHEKLLGSGRFLTDQTGYTAMRAYAKSWPARVWAVEGSSAPAASWLDGCSGPVSRWWTPARKTTRTRTPQSTG